MSVRERSFADSGHIPASRVIWQRVVSEENDMTTLRNRSTWLEFLDARLLDSCSDRPSKGEFFQDEDHRPASERTLSDWLAHAEQRGLVKGKKPIKLTRAGEVRRAEAWREFATDGRAMKLIERLDELADELTADHSNPTGRAAALLIKALHVFAQQITPGLERVVWKRVSGVLKADEQPDGG